MTWLRRHLWQLELLIGVVGVWLYFEAGQLTAWPWDVTTTQTMVWLFVAALAALAVVAGIVLHRPPGQAAWWLLAGALACNFLGDLVYYQPELVGPVQLTSPSVADLLYLLAYPFLALAIWALLRTRAPRSDRVASLDALILTVAAALVSWVQLVQPLLSQAAA
ncbi:MAG: hypothetical protein WAN48_07690, partial [Actinomycetes bacterium]